MDLTFEFRVPCPLCGWQHRCAQMSWGCHVNKHSIRIARSLIAGPGPRCPECGTRSDVTSVKPPRLVLDAGSTAKVVAFRHRKGWLAA